MKEKRFYSTGDIAKLLAMSPATISRAIDSGRLKASTTPGGHHRVLRKDLEDFLSANNIPADVLGSKKKRILVVEDNPAELRVFMRMLKKLPDIEVTGTVSGYKAGFLTRALKPDLILLDIFLKDVNGCEVARLIRSDPGLRFTKIIAVSVTEDPKDLQRIKRCGCNDFLQKPVSQDTLLEKVRTVLA